MKILIKSSLVACLLATLLVNPVAQGTQFDIKDSHIKHVLLISIDGLHAFDLQNFSTAHPHSALTELKRTGITYTQARVLGPADSFPGLMALVTGGTPAVTGVYFDVSYDRLLSPPGSDCQQQGTPIIYDESVDVPNAEIGKPMLQQALLPRGGEDCKPVYPHSYLQVNTVFEVIRHAGGHTAWIDKHPVYEIVNGPSGIGVEDLYTPEIGSNPEVGEGKLSDKITASIAGTERYDQSKVDALINQIHGFQHDGKTSAPVPMLFGLNLQAVSVAQKLAGYQARFGHPTPELAAAMANSDKQIGQIVAALREQHLLDSTLLVVTAKHGNGPVNPEKLRHVDEQALSRVVDKVAPHTLAFMAADRSALIWLHDQAKTAQVATALMRKSTQLGISQVLHGASLSLPSPGADTRTPDLIVLPKQGVIYCKLGDTKKAEHGGYDDDDTHVALLISNPSLAGAGKSNVARVTTTQVAPTMLLSLGLSPDALEAVKEQGAQVLPGEDWQAIGSK